MASTTNKRNKSNASQVQQKTGINREEMVLVRDGKSQNLMIIDIKNISLANKSSKIEVGAVVTWQNSSRERFRGIVLATGTESECSSTMRIIENNTIDEIVEISKEDQAPSESTIVFENEITIGKGETSASKKIPFKSSITIVKDLVEQSQIQIVNEPSDLINKSLDLHDNGGEDEHDTSSDDTTDESLQSSASLKRPLEQVAHSSSRDQPKKKLRGVVTVPFSVYSAKEKQCLLLQQQIDTYEQTWMPRPSIPAVIQYFIETANILTGNTDNDSREDKDEMLEKIKTDLNMSEEELVMCHGRSATKTVRRIAKFLYPNPTQGETIKSIAENAILSIIKYTRLSNPMDRTEDSELRHALSNYFSVKKFQHRFNQPQ